MILQSWIGKKVRIKRELLELITDEFEPEFQWFQIRDAHTLNQFVSKPESQVFYVLMDAWGTDLFPNRSEEVDTEELTLSHQLILRGGGFTGYPYLWDAKYFEVTDEPENN